MAGLQAELANGVGQGVRSAAGSVLVLGAYPGAGASTVAVLLAEVLADQGGGARLLDCANPLRSAASTVTEVELGEARPGWRRGRRGSLMVERLARFATGPEQVPEPPAAGERRVTVIDAGWPAGEMLGGRGWLTGQLQTARLVVVCRSTVPGVRHAERLLSTLDRPEQVVLAAVGPARWPAIVTGSAGPLLRQARTDGRLVPVPMDPRLEVEGMTQARLPRRLQLAGELLAKRVLPDHVLDHWAEPALVGGGR